MTAPREVSQHQIVAEWGEARQMLNDARLSDYSLPEAITILLGYRDNVANNRPATVVDLDGWRRSGSKSRHQSMRGGAR